MDLFVGHKSHELYYMENAFVVKDENNQSEGHVDLTSENSGVGTNNANIANSAAGSGTKDKPSCAC